PACSWLFLILFLFSSLCSLCLCGSFFLLPIQVQRQRLGHRGQRGGGALQRAGKYLEALLRQFLGLIVPGLLPQLDQVPRRHAVARRLGAVVLVLGAGEELLVIVRGIKEAARLVGVLLHHRVGQRLGLVQPFLRAGRVVQAEQAVDQEGVI